MIFLLGSNIRRGQDQEILAGSSPGWGRVPKFLLGVKPRTGPKLGTEPIDLRIQYQFLSKKTYFKYRNVDQKLYH